MVSSKAATPAGNSPGTRARRPLGKRNETNEPGRRADGSAKRDSFETGFGGAEDCVAWTASVTRRNTRWMARAIRHGPHRSTDGPGRALRAARARRGPPTVRRRLGRGGLAASEPEAQAQLAGRSRRMRLRAAPSIGNGTATGRVRTRACVHLPISQNCSPPHLGHVRFRTLKVTRQSRQRAVSLSRTACPNPDAAPISESDHPGWFDRSWTPMGASFFLATLRLPSPPPASPGPAGPTRVSRFPVLGGRF